MARLGDICEIVSGTTPKTTEPLFWDGNIKWITPAELSDNSFYVSDTERHITETGQKKSHLSLMPEGTVLLSSRAPIGKTAIVKSPMCCNQGFKNLICGPKVFNEYLYFFLTARKDYLNSLGRGATFKEISKKIVENIEIPLPALEEQQYRAGVLKKLNELIEKKCTQIAALNALVKSQFVEMFGNPLTNPKGWCTSTLRDICTLKTGNTPPRAIKEYYGTYIEWIKSDNIQKNSLYLTTAKECLSEKGALVGRVVKQGCILMTCIAGSLNTIGNMAITTKSVAFNQQITALEPKDTDVLFLYYMLRLSRSKIHEIAQSALKCIVNKSALAQIPVFLPPLQSQHHFSEFVERVDKSKFAIQQSLEKLQTLKCSLMQMYFS